MLSSLDTFDIAGVSLGFIALLVAAVAGLERFSALDSMVLTPLEQSTDWNFDQNPQALLSEMDQEELKRLSIALPDLDLSPRAENTVAEQRALREELWRLYRLDHRSFDALVETQKDQQLRMLWHLHLEQRLIETLSFDRRMHYMKYMPYGQSSDYLLRSNPPFTICGNLSAPLPNAEHQLLIDEYRLDLMRLAAGDYNRARHLRNEMIVRGASLWDPHPDFYWFVYKLAQMQDPRLVPPDAFAIPEPRLNASGERQQQLSSWLETHDVFALVNFLPRCKHRR
ncbi:MAG: hypothetical protein AAFY73_05265 [Pseudomonadota bacterium]